MGCGDTEVGPTGGVGIPGRPSEELRKLGLLVGNAPLLEDAEKVMILIGGTTILSLVGNGPSLEDVEKVMMLIGGTTILSLVGKGRSLEDGGKDIILIGGTTILALGTPYVGYGARVFVSEAVIVPELPVLYGIENEYEAGCVVGNTT